MPSNSSTSSTLKVAVLANPQLAHGRNFFRGVIRYLQEQSPLIQVDLLTNEPVIQLSTLRQYDGIVTALNEPLLNELDSGTPIIRFDKTIDGGSAVELPMDHEQIGKLAADTLDTCGIVSAGYYDGIRGDDEQNCRRSALRLAGFKKQIGNLGHPNFPRPVSVHTPTNYKQLREWILNLPKPCGIFTYNDHGALEVSEACRLEGLSVPEEIAIIGVDNDQLFCKLSHPPLSSINPGTESQAYEAIHQILRRLEPEKYTSNSDSSSAITIEHRESTGRSSTPDLTVQKALTYIQRSDNNLLPQDVARAVGQSLRGLEALFKKHIQTTVQLEIIKQRTERVKERLRNTDLSIEQIGESLNYEVTQLRRNFQQFHEITLSQYRNQFRDTAAKTSKISSTQKKLSLCFFNSLRGQSALEILRGAEARLHNYPDVHLSIHIDRYIKGGIQQDSIVYKPFDSYDGLIVTTESHLPKELSNSKPVLCIDHQRAYPKSCSLSIDNEELGTLAAEHFLLKGHTHFAYISYSGQYLAATDEHTEDTRTDGRFNGFHNTLLEAGIPKESIHHQSYMDKTSIKQWLLDLPKPIALLAFNDTLAIEVLGFCKELNIPVPADIALLGIDNDPFLANRTHPALSSIENRFQRMGAEAIDHLVAMIRNPNAPFPKEIKISPRIVNERASTYPIATNNLTINQAVSYTRKYYASSLHTEDIAQHCGVSRRKLEGLYKTHLRQSPRNHLEVIRLRAAKDRLTQSADSVEMIAHETGFKEARYFCQVFKKHTNQTPLKYRQSRGV